MSDTISSHEKNTALGLAENTPEIMLNRLKEAEKAIRACLTACDPDGDSGDSSATGLLELSVVMPYLNEADTLATCMGKASEAMRSHGIQGEIIVADNGSTDGSIQIANDLGARVVHVRDKGYGNALMGGIQAARGRFVIMGDVDDSYNFLEIPKFIDKLRDGHQLVQGCRLPSGGGTVLPGAMPKLVPYWQSPAANQPEVGQVTGRTRPNSGS